MPNDPKPHIKLNNGYYQELPYIFPKQIGGGDGFSVIERNRAIHAKLLLTQLNTLQQQFDIAKDIEVPENIVKDEIVYVEFTSEWGYELKFESLDQDSGNAKKFQLLNVIIEEREENGTREFRDHATLLLHESGVSAFIDKVNKYLTENFIKTDRDTGEKIDTGNPKNYKLLNNIQIIRLATLKAFWTDAPEISFPDTEESIWWEVWFRRTNNDNERMARVFQNLIEVGCEIGVSELQLVEHRVRLIKGTAHQLAQSLLLLDNLSELRKPQEITDFIFHKDVDYEDKRDYLEDLIGRTESTLDGNSTLVCLIDSGVNNQHPLISPFLPDSHRYSYNPDWGNNDSVSNGGHGTGAASLVLYGDLTDVIVTPDRIQIYHGLESYKIYNPHDLNNPKLYGAITEEAVNTPIVDRPNNLRIYCMTVTDENLALRGRPSSWSAAIDKVTFGIAIEPKEQQVFIVSGGNVEITKHDDFPSKNETESIHDPGQSYNAITVGAYTKKDRINIATGLSPLAANGYMSPSNSTSLLWEPQWPNKPDIVMEGGNASTDGTDVSDHESLKLIAADAEFPNFIFCPFGDTSAAAALAAKMAAELRNEYPSFWPETIRGLLIHSADWTSSMLNGRQFNTLNEQDRKNLLRVFGYGAPSLERARYSANNSLTLIIEKEIQPYKKGKSGGQYNEYHLYELPWPAEVLRDLQEVDSTLTITLSYYIEPNPGSKRYINSYQYHSHSLDFAVIKPNEPIDVFKRRISAAAELPDDERNNKGELWSIGRPGQKGSIRKDFITMSAIDLSQRNIIAIYPKNGWYKTRKKLNRFDEKVRYSLIVNIQTQEADLYTPVLNMIENELLL